MIKMMRTAAFLTCGVLASSAAAVAFAMTQRPGGAPASAPAADDLVAKMFAFDRDKNNTLSKSEITDERLLRIFDRADADKDGSVTKDELTALSAKEPVSRGPGGPGGPMMGMPRPGEILPQMFQQRLNLSDEQKEQVAALQKDVDAKLAKILTEDQAKQLKEMRDRRPGRGGPGGPGGPGRGGPGGPGGPGGDGPPPGRPD